MGSDGPKAILHLDSATAWQGLSGVWKTGALADVLLLANDGTQFNAHRLVLCGASGYFRSLLLGAGACMREGNQPSLGTSPRLIVPLSFSGAELAEVLAAIYDLQIEVGPENLERVLYAASYLDIPGMVDACATYMRSLLNLTTAVPLLRLASRYGILGLRAELLQYVSVKFSSLLSTPVAEGSAVPHTQQLGGPCMHVALQCRDSQGGCAPAAPPSPLAELSKDLLLEILLADELAVDCEADVLQAVIDWVSADPVARLRDLGDLLTAVRAEQLPSSLSLAIPSAGQGDGARAAVVQAVQGALTMQQHRAPDPGTPSTSHHHHHRAEGANTPVPEHTVEGSPSLNAGRERPSTPGLGAAHSPTVRAQLASGRQRQETTTAKQLNGHNSIAVDDFMQPKAGFTAAHIPQQAAQKQHVVRAFGRRRKYQATQLCAAGGHDATWRSLKLVELYDPVIDAWTPGPSMLHAVSFAGAALVDRDVYMVGGTPLWSCIAKLSSGSSAWQVCPNLVTTRAHAGVTSAAGSLLVLGGRTQVQAVQQVLATVEVWTPQRNSWADGPCMSVPRSALASTGLGGGVFAVGGASARHTLRTVERFDLGQEAWATLSAEMHVERKYCAAATLERRLYVVGGLDEVRTRLASVEALDPREGKWAQLAPLSAARSSCGLAALTIGAHGRIYAVGGSAPGDSHVHATVEAYVPEMNKWVPVAPLGYGRSGLALCAL